MTGYCQHCKKNVEMDNIETIQLPDLSFIQRGEHTVGRLQHTIWKKVDDQNLIVTGVGRRVPDIVYASRRTPKNLWAVSVGQRVVSFEKHIPNLDPDKNIKGKTLDEIKRKVADEKKIAVHNLRD